MGGDYGVDSGRLLPTLVQEDLVYERLKLAGTSVKPGKADLLLVQRRSLKVDQKPKALSISSYF